MVVINSCVETKTRLNSSRPVYRLVETFNLKKISLTRGRDTRASRSLCSTTCGERMNIIQILTGAEGNIDYISP